MTPLDATGFTQGEAKEADGDPGREDVLKAIRELRAEVVGLRSEISGLSASKKGRARPPRQLLSSREAAAQLGVDRGTTLRYLVGAKKIRTVKVNGRFKIPLSEVQRLAAEGFDTRQD